MEKAVKETWWKGYQQIEYCRFADDMVIFVNGHDALKWLVDKAWKRLQQELERLQVNLNTEKTRIVNLEKEEIFTFLEFEYRLTRNRGKKIVLIRRRMRENFTYGSKWRVMETGQIATAPSFDPTITI